MATTVNNPIESFWSHVKKIKGGCWLWTGAAFSNGYGMFTVNRCKSRQTGCGTFKAHRYSWILKHGKIPDGLKVLHSCDVQLCVRPSHLFLGTNAVNSRDMVQKRRQAFGEWHGMAKLTFEDVLKIRRLLAHKKTSVNSLARELGVNRCTIHRAFRSRSWGR